MGLVARAHGELPRTFHVIIDLIASQFTDWNLKLFDIYHGTCKSAFLQQAWRCLGLALHRGRAKLVLDRCRNPV